MSGKKGKKERKRSKIDRTKPVAQQWHQYNDARASRSSEPTLTTPPVTRKSAPISIDPNNIWKTVDELLDRPTLEEGLQGNLVGASAASSKAAARNQESGSEDEDSVLEQSRTQSPRLNIRYKNSRSPSRERGSRYRDDRSRSPSQDRGRKGSSSRPASGQKKDQDPIDLISYGDSDRERERRDRRHDRDRDGRSASPGHHRSKKDMRDTKDERRLEDQANSLEAARHAKQLANMRDQIAELKGQIVDEENKYDDLHTEFEALKIKHGLLENAHAHMTAALTHIRNHPENLISQISKRGSGSRRKGKRNPGGEHFVDDGATEAGMLTIGKEAVKAVYRVIKFINNDAQEKMFMDQVMNNLGKQELIVDPNMTEDQKAMIEEKRKQCCDGYGGAWVKELNDHRTYVQAQMKKALLEWMTKTNRQALPEPEVFIKNIATRDFSQWDLLDTDTEDEKKAKTASKKETMDLFDAYTEIMVWAVAGTKLWNANIRHFEPMTTSKLPKTAIDQLRIPASTEAMAILAYMNNYKKWNASFDYKKTHPGKGKVPMWSCKKPDELVEYKEAYSSGKDKIENPQWGGWSDEGRMKFVELQAIITKSRQDNFDRHVKEDQACVDRLKEYFKEMHKDSDRPTKIQKLPTPTNRDESKFTFIVEL